MKMTLKTPPKCMFFGGDVPPRGPTGVIFGGTQWGTPIHIVTKFDQDRLRTEGARLWTDRQTDKPGGVEDLRVP